MSASQTPVCKVCHSPSEYLGEKLGNWIQRPFRLARCTSCGFSWVLDVETDYARIYSEDYYRGRGADPMVNYLEELESPDTAIRQFEWQGILDVVEKLATPRLGTKWLDFGCGGGGLVRYVASKRPFEVCGFEEGWIADRARAQGIQILKDSELSGQKFDIVTAIEVLEHVEDPIAVLQKIRALLRPNGLFFYTTGNAAIHQKDLIKWPYVIPEIHISFFTPQSLEVALKMTGFRPEQAAYGKGLSRIFAFKVLKNLGFRQLTVWQRILPWQWITPLIEARFRYQELPVGWADPGFSN